MRFTTFLLTGFLVLLPLSLSAIAKQADPALSENTAAINSVKPPNFASHEGQVYSSGQPAKDELKMLAQKGIKHVINLRSRHEQNWDESELVKQLGMTYHSLPITSAEDINTENAAKLTALINKLKGEGVLVHCASSNRVGALIAISAYLKGLNNEAAIDEGKRWGLKSLEPVAQSVINQSSGL